MYMRGYSVFRPPYGGGSTFGRYNLTQIYFWFETKIWFEMNLASREKLQTHVNFVLSCKVHAWLQWVPLTFGGGASLPEDII